MKPLGLSVSQSSYIALTYPWFTMDSVRTLQRQVREYEEKNRQREQEDRLKAKTASMESILASPDVTLPSAAKASTIQLYENLSGLKVLPRNIHAQSSKEKLPTTWDCEHSTPRGSKFLFFLLRIHM